MGKRRLAAGTDRGAVVSELAQEYRILGKKYPDQAFAFPKGISDDELKLRGLWNSAILQYRIDHMRQLADAFPASPTRPPKFGFYVFSQERHVFAFHNFAAEYSAKKFLELMINDRPYKWINDYTIIVADDLTIRSEGYNELQDTLEYEYKRGEVDWEIPDPYLRSYIQLRDRSKVTIHAPAQPDNDASNTRFKNSAGMKDHRKDVQRAQKPAEALTIEDAISRAGVKIDASKARACFRKANLTKPDGGWYFTEGTIGLAVQAIKEHSK